MRITQRMIHENNVQDIEENLARIALLQKQISTGKSVEKASDDPIAATKALTLRSSLSISEAYLKTADHVESWLNATDLALDKTIDLTTEAITLLQRGVSDSESDSQRQALSSQIDELLVEAVDIANSKVLDAYIFSGYLTDTKPFTISSPDTVTYDGDAGITQLSISAGQTVVKNLNGESTFSPLFSALIDARDALLASDQAAMQNALQALNEASSQLSESRTMVGARLQRVEATRQFTEDAQLEINSLLSDVEDVNLAEAISNLNYQETIYEAILEVSKKVITMPNLFDFLS
jgi:flagellar hook-associated protein 3 FlgL